MNFPCYSTLIICFLVLITSCRAAEEGSTTTATVSERTPTTSTESSQEPPTTTTSPEEGTQTTSTVIAESPTTTLVTEETPTTTIAPEKAPTHLYFGTAAQGLRSFSLESSQIGYISSGSDDVEGVTFDPVQNQVYWCTAYAIYRANADGSDEKYVFNASKISEWSLTDVKYDWMTGNLYAVNRYGYMYICNTSEAVDQLSCALFVGGQGGIIGMALYPEKRIMFWTNNWSYCIVRAGMDGQNITQIVKSLFNPTGITIDRHESKVYWTDGSLYRIYSAGFDGEDFKLVLQLPRGIIPWGIAVTQDRIYWGTYQAEYDEKEGGGRLQSRDKYGHGIRTLYKSNSAIQHLILVSLDTQRLQLANQ